MAKKTREQKPDGVGTRNFWTQDEELLLAKRYIQISEDPNVVRVHEYVVVGPVDTKQIVLRYGITFVGSDSEVMKGLSECKASENNVRRIQVKDIVKEVEDHLKTYSSAGMDISCQSAVSISGFE
nr:hypothetical protein [Tanacetum cinerariifolium]